MVTLQHSQDVVVTADAAAAVVHMRWPYSRTLAAVHLHTTSAAASVLWMAGAVGSQTQASPSWESHERCCDLDYRIRHHWMVLLGMARIARSRGKDPR